jgi:hypothetical protein
MIAHDVSEMGQFELHWMLGRGEFDDLVEMAKAAPDEIHLFPVSIGPPGAVILAVVAISPAAQADLERRLA